MNASQTKKIFEPESAEELLRGWLLHSHKGRQRHDRAARRLDTARVGLGAAATAFAVVVSTSVFADLGKCLPGSWKPILSVVIPVISLFSAILTGLSTFLNLAERTDKHRSAGVRYKAMIRELERRLSEEAGNSSITPPLIGEIQKRLDELEESAPIVPERIFLFVDKEWALHGVKTITKADDLYNSKTPSTTPEHL